MDVSSLDEDFLLLRILQKARVSSDETSYFIFHLIEDLQLLTLKLLAVILTPTGTVYMLLGDEWRQPEERRQFDCHKAILTPGSKSQAFVVVNISPRQSHSNGCPVGFPGESRHLSFSLVAASWTSSGCKSDHPQLLILPSGSVGTFHGGKYLHDVILTQSSFHTSPKVRNRVSDSRSCVSSHRLAFSFCGLCRFFLLETGTGA